MTGAQINTLEMADVTYAILAKAAETREDRGIAAAFATFNAQREAIHALSNVQRQPTAGRTKERAAAFSAAAETLFVVVGRVLAYADVHRLGDLGAQVRWPRHRLNRVRITRRLGVMRHVLAAARSVLPQIEEMGVTPAMLAEFEAQIVAAEAEESLPRLSIVVRGTATKHLAEKFSELDRILTQQLDRVMLAVARSNPDLYVRYRAARMVIDRHGSRREAAGQTAAPAAPATPASEQPLAA